jgi:hypothetical protein
VRPLAQEDAVSQQELEAAIAREAGDEASVEAAAMWPSLRKPRKRSSPKRRNDRSWVSFLPRSKPTRRGSRSRSTGKKTHVFDNSLAQRYFSC